MPESNGFQNPNIESITFHSPIEGSTIDSDEKNVNLIPTSEQPERTGLRGYIETKKGKAFVAGTTALALIGIGFGALKIGETTSGTNETKPGSSNGQTAVISQEERDFINAYKNRYADPKAVFNSEVAYLIANPGKDLTVGPDYFTGYNFDATPNAATSPLGFDILKLQPGAEVTTQTSVDQFNQALPEMNRFMNLLAKNPLPNQVSVIKDEFNKYTGFYNPSSPKLVDILAGVVSKYGSNAVYVINSGTTDVSADKLKATIFDNIPPVIDNINSSGVTDSFQSTAHLSITVTSYDKANKTVVATEIIDNLQFSVNRAESADPMNVGLIGIGAK
ncbi:MAG: hypothetical protein EOT05_01250 [Candidatus Microsaccharimonas sossegonensis]|uniref:Uncharacterized protein n=1 Tax=Candidatus Microsaccharimonas sossegonensis TaxID=2506948 RepID=A0A4Q0AH06_9BACT|nr:MAG: hypothetical protein EOT05_01250 [Candidatus Microsaccharimonas sossegonensis]